MKNSWVMIATLLMAGAAHGLTTPSAADGPVKLLGCLVGANGVLEAEVQSQSDDTLLCNVTCTYELGGKTFSRHFDVRVPARFQGRVGRFDTNNARAGRYPGSISRCEKLTR